MEIIEEVARLRSEGQDVISLCVGEPSLGPPADVMDAAMRAHDGSVSTGYTPALGLRELRERIAGFYRTDRGLEVSSHDVAVTTGSSGAFVAIFLAAFDAGDRVAVTLPGYPAYRNILRAYGCEVVDIVCDSSVGYQPSVDLLEAAFAQGPLQGLVIASPANPTGSMIHRDRLAELLRWAERRGVRVISDEIYHGITFPDSQGVRIEAAGAWEFSRTAVVVSSFSKYWGMTGWRLGWALVPEDLREAVSRLAGNMALCPPSAPQIAALEAFTPSALAHCEAAVRQYTQTRSTFLARVHELDWGTSAPAEGAFYYYADLGRQLTRWPSSTVYAKELLRAAKVAVTPGIDFDPANGENSVRVSFAVTPAEIDAAIDRIVAFQAAAGG